MSPDTLRTARAACLEVHELAPGEYLVQGGRQPHHVTLEPPACDCRDFAFRGGPCKHLRAVALRQGDSATWDALGAFLRQALP